MIKRGINIFTDAYSEMKHSLLILFILFSAGLEAQVSVHADITTGCNPLTVNFSIQPESARDTITSYQWNFGNWTTVSSDSTPTITYTLTGVFDVICTVNGLYQITADAYITVLECSDTLKVPNVFTPNDDTFNDFFEVETNGINSYSFSVYTRSGTLVYKTESPSIFWDGRSLSGQKLKNGIYFYTIRQQDSQPLNELKGFVYLYE